MATEYINPQWRLPNEKTGNNQGYSMDINASNNRVSTGYFLPSGTKPKSISYWFKNTDPNGWSTTGYNYTIHGGSLSSAGNGFGMGTLGSNFGAYLWFIGHSSGDYLIPSSATGVMTTDVWYHIVVTYDNSRTNNLHFYLDGVKINETNETLDTSSANSVKIGSSATGGGNQGGRFMEVTDLSIFDHALSDGGVATGSSASGDVGALYNSGNPGNPMALASPPQAYYPLGNSAHMGSNYLTPNAALQDYVYFFNGNSMFDAKITSGGGGDIFSNATNFSFSGWFNLGANYSYKSIFSIKDNTTGVFSFAINMYGNQLRFSVATAYAWIADLDDIVPYNTWFHYAGVFDGSGASATDRLKLYINGEPQTVVFTSTTPPTSFPTISSNSVFGLGGNPIGASWSGFTGYSTALQLWKSSLTPSEITTLYNYGSPIQTLANIPQSSNLKLWYKLDASEVYDIATTEWKVNQAQAPYQNSVLCPNVSGQNVTDYLQVSNYSGTTGKTAASWSFWYNASEANPQSGALSGGVAEFKRNIDGQYKGMEFTLYTEVAGVNATFTTRGARLGGRYMDMPAAGNNAGIQGIGDWVNIVLVYDGSDPAPDLVNGGFASQSGSIRAYANGAQGFLLGTLNQYNGVYPAEGTIRTGSLIFGGGDFATRHMSASLSNYATWDKALTQAEVNEIVNNGQPKDLSTHSASSDLISWWKLNNLTTGLVDTIGGYNASIVGSNSYTNAGSVSQLNGTSSGMNQASLVQSDLLTTTGYSPYALQFDGLSDKIDCGVSPFDETTGDITISAWVKRTSAAATYAPIVSATQGVGGANTQFSFQFYGNSLSLFWKGLGSPDLENVPTSAFTVANDVWYLVNFVRTGTTGRFYVNGNFIHLSTKTYDDFISTGTPNLSIGAWWFSSNASVTGSISNVALWNTSLSAVELREVYNEGRPSNLNNFSGTAPIHWWQLGSNSSFTSPDWTCLDEIGSSDGISSNMIEDRIVNGVGSSGNGVSVNMGLANNISGSSPSGEANGLSVNMTLANITGGVN